jgi:two-component system, chemotaxis family, CheB/CheR fusion protein
VQSGETRFGAERYLAAHAAAPPRAPESRANGNERLGSLLALSGLGVVVVDRHYDIVAVNAAARAMLEIHGVAVGDDLIHLVRNVDGLELRAAIDSAFRNDALPARELPVREPTADVERWLQISCVPERPLSDAPAEVVGVFIVDVTESVGRRRESERTLAEQRTHLEELSSRIEELSRRQKTPMKANDELTNANAELRIVNEQLLINAEEAASANEEIETLNEEMQAPNEELETLNEELQATVEELNTTNDELEARGRDLQRLASEREQELERLSGERALMSAAIDSGPLAILNANGTVVYASARIGGAEAIRALGESWWRNGSVRLGETEYQPYLETTGQADMMVVTLRNVS